ncbi:hypothetical protein P9074_11315 [Gallibacterium anatis]|uniref:hypothetical protein n=1 Tax=Gallibacterium anatis TaxID=750 RepID=UPI000531CDA6|nr:hypothetical protein [Gallibacterium anatis]KGQ68511.1 hypothetical protein IO47_04420 [Gallibacterium anatis]
MKLAKVQNIETTKILKEAKKDKKEKQFSFYIDEDLLLAVKRKCLENNFSVKDYINNLIYNDINK